MEGPAVVLQEQGGGEQVVTLLRGPHAGGDGAGTPPDAVEQAGGLRLDSLAHAAAGGLSGPALKPGDSGASLLYRRLTTTDTALRMPGYQMAIAPPIRTRIDMLTTGVRTPVGIKVFGQDLNEIERISVALEGMLRQVPGTRSTFAERQTGREYVDIVPNRDAIARYGLTVRDVQDIVEAAVGGMPSAQGQPSSSARWTTSPQVSLPA
mgnify:CR=1 FL=1